MVGTVHIMGFQNLARQHYGFMKVASNVPWVLVDKVFYRIYLVEIDCREML